MIVTIEDILFFIIFFGISSIINIVAFVLVQNWFLQESKDNISKIIQTLPARLARSSSSKEMGTADYLLGAAQIIIDMRKEGVSIQDIVSEISGLQQATPSEEQNL